jgi:hypothetical protein
MLLADPFGHQSQPGCSIGVGERLAARHLRDVLRRMKIVGVGERMSKVRGEAAGKRGLP